MVSELVKCCSRRVFLFEAVLVVDRRYVIGDVGEDDFFKEFGCWGQEGNGSIVGALVGIFVHSTGHPSFTTSTSGFRKTKTKVGLRFPRSGNHVSKLVKHPPSCQHLSFWNTNHFQN